MLLIVLIVAFILIIVTVELTCLFGYSMKEKIENIKVEYNNEEDKIEFLEQVTGKIFTKHEYDDNQTLKLGCNSIIFFEDYDIFLDRSIKLEKFTLYPLTGESTVDLINYKGDVIYIYIN